MELHNPLDPVGARRKEGGSEMEGVLFLPEAGARDDADTGSVEEVQTVEFIGGTAFRGCGLDGFLGKGDGREQVHGSLVRAVSGWSRED